MVFDRRRRSCSNRTADIFVVRGREIRITVACEAELIHMPSKYMGSFQGCCRARVRKGREYILSAVHSLLRI